MTDNMLYNIWLEIGEMHYPESDRLRIAKPITEAIEKMDFFQHLHELSEKYPDFVYTSNIYGISGDFPYSAWTPVAWRDYVFVPISPYAEYRFFPNKNKKDGNEVFWNIPERIPKWIKEPVLEIDAQNQKLRELFAKTVKIINDKAYRNKEALFKAFPDAEEAYQRILAAEKQKKAADSGIDKINAMLQEVTA